ncbi:MAG TPA: adenylyltransferase/cytidyltransferase family protein, partial [Alphaproteobacteria bacterium]|nr:adenylyltransferase/cytidyltransferase family protein [Alphaproteobacteria bacterium]
MKHNDLSDTTAQLPQGSVLIIGNFDAVHLGHLYLIEQARATADLKETDLSVLTFAPHPRRLFRPEDKPFRITPDAQKIKALEATGKINHLSTLPFDW